MQLKREQCFGLVFFLPINGIFSVQLPVFTLSSKTKQDITLKVDVLVKLFDCRPSASQIGSNSI